MQIEDDQLNSIDPFKMLQEMKSGYDFNDVFYYFHMRHLGNSIKVAIVTHDFDFSFPGIDILTVNRKLLKA